jgi:hypothetical protein
MHSAKQYQIVLSNMGQVDSDDIKYLVQLHDQDTKEQALSVEAVMVLSLNSFHFIGDDTEERLGGVGIDIYDLQENGCPDWEAFDRFYFLLKKWVFSESNSYLSQKDKRVFYSFID